MRRLSGERGNGAITAAVIGGVFALIGTLLTIYFTVLYHSDGSSTPTKRPEITLPSNIAASVFLSKESAPAGGTVLVSGEGFAANEKIDIEIQTISVASTRADSGGKFSSIVIVIPEELGKFAPQQFDVVAIGRSSAKAGQAPIEVSG